MAADLNSPEQVLVKVLKSANIAMAALGTSPLPDQIPLAIHCRGCKNAYAVFPGLALPDNDPETLPAIFLMSLFIGYSADTRTKSLLLSSTLRTAQTSLLSIDPLIRALILIIQNT